MVKPHATSTPSLASTARSVQVPSDKNNSDARTVSFGNAAIGMGWQLAVVVLLPIMGGFKLDSRLNTLPLWTLVGLVLAMVGSILVIRRALASFGNFNVPSTDAAVSTQPKENS